MRNNRTNFYTISMTIIFHPTKKELASSLTTPTTIINITNNCILSLEEFDY
jgi:hypothetical protein